MVRTTISGLSIRSAVLSILKWCWNLITRKWFDRSSISIESNTAPQEQPVAVTQSVIPKCSHSNKQPMNKKFLSYQPLTPSGSRVNSLVIHPRKDLAAIIENMTVLRIFDLNSIKNTVSENSNASKFQLHYKRYPLEGQQCVLADFSYDADAIFMILESGFLASYSLRENDPKALTIRSSVRLHKNEVTWMISSKCRCVITACNATDTKVKIWSYNGEPLQQFDTHHIQNFDLCTSPVNARFLACPGWTPDIQIYEFSTHQGDFKRIAKAMHLSTSKHILQMAISPDNTRAVLVDKDKTLTLWNIGVRYAEKEDPKILNVLNNDESLSTLRMINYTHSGKHLLAIVRGGLLILDAETLKIKSHYKIEAANQPQIFALAPHSQYFILYADSKVPRVYFLPPEL